MDEKGFHSVRTTPSSSRMRMSVSDIVAIIATLQQIRGPVDFRLMIFTLKQQGFISENDYSYVIAKLSSFQGTRTEKLMLCIKELASLVTLNDIVSVLDRIGEGNIAHALSQSRCSGALRCTPTRRAVTSSTMHLNYNRLKTMIGNNSFRVDRFVDFQDMTYYLTGLIECSGSLGGRQQAFDNLAVVVCLRVHLYEDIPRREAILEEMLALSENNNELDTTCATVVYFVSKCYIARKQDKIEKARTYLAEAKQHCLTHDNSLMKALVFHAEHALHRKLYAIEPSEENLNQSIVSCERGMACMAAEPSDARQKWVRDFQLFKALALLGIGQEYKIERSTEVRFENREHARVILNSINVDFRQNNREWDDRRETMYRVCMARLHEDSNLKKAMANLDLAIETGLTGNYTRAEHHHIVEYKRLLEEKMSGISTVYERVPKQTSFQETGE